jgi:hypothetical protein
LDASSTLLVSNKYSEIRTFTDENNQIL